MNNAKTNNSTTGIRWTFREVLHGKSYVALAFCIISAFVILAISLAINAIGNNPSTKLSVILATLIKNAMSLKANGIALDLAAVLMLIAIPSTICWPIYVGILTLYYNHRDRDFPPTEENLEIHRLEAEFAWSWPWSLLFGIFDFTASFSLLTSLQILLFPNMSDAGQGLYSALATLVCLVFAERRVTRLSSGAASHLPGNSIVVNSILDGSADEFMPEDCRNDFCRAKVATVVRRGIVRSPHWAAIIVKGISLRTTVKMFSGFLNSAIHGILTAISFGIAATAANSIGFVGGQFASGNGEAYVQSLRDPEPTPPRFIIEIIAIVVSNAFALLYILGIIQ